MSIAYPPARMLEPFGAFGSVMNHQLVVHNWHDRATSRDSAECVEKGVGVAFAEGLLTTESRRHGVSRVSRIATVLVGRSPISQCAGAGDNPLDNGCEEAVAAFRGLFRCLPWKSPTMI